jgi:hypothetical protein
MERSVSWRARQMISAMVSSATERELEKGELKTAMPRRAAVLRSTWLVPMQKQPITMRFLADSRTRAVSLVLERMPITWTSLWLPVLAFILYWI